MWILFNFYKTKNVQQKYPHIYFRYVIGEIRNLEYYLKVYVTFESNAGNYFFGIITGIVYHHFNSKGKKLESIKVNIIIHYFKYLIIES